MLRTFLIEEYRRHIAYVKRLSFYLFPLYVIAFTGLFALLFDDIVAESGYATTMLTLLGGYALYGVGSGAFGFLGQQYMQRNFREFYLISLPALHPIRYRHTFMLVYIRDLVYYSVLMIFPVTAGLALTQPVSGFSWYSIARFTLCSFLAFMYGYSLSFLMSILFFRNRAAFAAVGLAVALYLAGGAVGVLSRALVLPFYALYMTSDFRWFIASVVFCIVTTLLGYIATPDEFIFRERRAGKLLPRLEFRAFGESRTLVAKEITDMVRGRVFYKVIAAYVVPVFLLGVLSRIIDIAAPEVYGSTLFYAVMLGFFSVVLYSWLTNLDDYSYMNLLPVRMPDLLRIHIITYMLVSTVLTLPLLFLLSAALGEMYLFPVAAWIFTVNSFYLITLIVYLTGNRTYSMLFDPEVIVKFGVATILPEVALLIITMVGYRDPLLFAWSIGIFTSVLLLNAVLYYSGAKKRWLEEEF
jgi:hypothetical protein